MKTIPHFPEMPYYPGNRYSEPDLNAKPIPRVILKDGAWISNPEWEAAPYEDVILDKKWAKRVEAGERLPEH